MCIYGYKYTIFRLNLFYFVIRFSHFFQNFANLYAKMALSIVILISLVACYSYFEG